MFFFFVLNILLEKLLTSDGRELRSALFSLKQIFQDDKDLVHGFVALGGLNSLVKVGNNADQNYQNYILRALGQVRHTYFFLIYLLLLNRARMPRSKIFIFNICKRYSEYEYGDFVQTNPEKAISWIFVVSTARNSNIRASGKRARERKEERKIVETEIEAEKELRTMFKWKMLCLYMLGVFNILNDMGTYAHVNRTLDSDLISL